MAIIFYGNLNKPDMEASHTQDKMNTPYKKLIKLILLILLSFSPLINVLAQPVWVPTTPSVGTTGPLTIPVNYGIDRTGTVYIIVYDYEETIILLTGAVVKGRALSPPSGSRVAVAAIPVNAGQVGNIIQYIFNVFKANQIHTIYLAAEDSFGNIQAMSIRIYAKTQPCPKIDVLTGFTQPILCVNKGATAVFKVTVDDPPNSGILKGTTWFIDWGDGTSLTYTSTADYDVPPLATRTHTYSTVTSCNYVFSNTIRNPCGETRSVQYIAVVHGRDIPSDGDGILQIVNNANGSTTIQVCAGTQSVITIRDNSTWNCQNPVLPGGFTAVPNTDPRNIEWLYGQDPTGGTTNTISGTVSIASLGNAPQTSGRISPTPYGPASLSQTITIPATCQAGEYFRVYMKEWNKCNWTDPEYVNTYVDILVIAAPAAPTVPDKIICYDGDTELQVTSTPVGTITWYGNSSLTLPALTTGTSYSPATPGSGIYNYWVTDQSTSGLMCVSPATMVTLYEREDLSRPGPITGPAQVCSNTGGYVFTSNTTPPNNLIGGQVEYIWTVPAGWTITAGQGSNSITVTTNNSSGSKTLSAVARYVNDPPDCTTASRSTTTNQNPIATISSAATKTVCNTTPLAYTITSGTAGCTFAWSRAAVAGISNPAASGTGSSINESLTNTTTGAVNAVYLITPTINGCTGTTFTLTVTVNPTAVITSGLSVTKCNTTALGYTITSSTAGTTFAWSRAAVAGISNAAASGTGSSLNESLTNTTTTSVNVTYVLTPSYGGCAGTQSSLIVTVNPTAVISSSLTKSICDNASTAYTITSSTAGATFAWSRAAVAGVSNAAASGTGSNISENLNNTVTNPVNVTYILTPSYGGCTGTPSNLVVTVHPTAVITSGLTLTKCNNAALGYTITSSTTGATFAWSRAAVAGISNAAASGTGSSINESLINTTTAPVNVTYVLTPSSGGCAGTPSNLVVTVNPAAVITSGLAVTKCNTTALGYTITSSTAGATFAWSRAAVAGISNVAASGTGSSINESLTSTTTSPVNVTYILTPSYGGCAGTPSNLIVTVNPTAVINSSLAVSKCNSTALGYTITSSTAGATFAWSRAAVAGISNAAASGTGSSINESLVNTTTAAVNVTYVLTPSYGGCTGTSSNLIVTVNPTAVITSTLTRTICSNATLGYTITSSTAGATFAWSRTAIGGISNPAASGTGSSINESLINTTGADINVTYVLTPSYGGCSGTPSNLVVTVHPQFTLAQLHSDISICNNTATNLNVTLTGGTSPYTINYTRNGSAQTALTSYVSGTNFSTGTLTTGSYIYAITSVTDFYGCPVQSTGTNITVTVGAALTSATLTGSGNACLGSTSILKSVISGGAPPYTLVITGFGTQNNYSSNTDIPLGVLTLGAHNYTLATVTDACTNSISPNVNYSITIYDNPNISATAPATQTICNDGTATITLNSTVSNTIFSYTVASSPAAGYSWTAGKNPIAGSITDGDGNGTETLSRTLKHDNTAPVTVTYTITPTGPGATACPGIAVTRDVVVNPTALITSAATQTVCDNTALGYTATSSTAGATFAWTRAAVAGISNAAGSGATALINESLDNTTTAPVNVTYIITPSYGTCTGTPFNLVVTVNPTAVITSAATKTICDNASTAYTATSSTVGATFAWTRAAVAGISNAAGSGATSAINENLDNTTTAPVNVTYVITPSYGTCAGTPFNLVVTVNPTAVITSAATQTVCDNTALGYTATSSTAGATFAWTRAAVAGISNAAGSGATALINESLDNTTTAPVNVTYIITPSFGTCTGTPFNLVVTVNPTAVITSAATKTICDNASTAYTATSSTVGATFAWTRAVVAGISNAAGSGATALINESLDNSTTAPVNVTYVITPSYGTCTGTPFNLVVTVNPTALITSAATQTICDNNALGYTATSSTTGATFAWTRAAVAGISNAAGSGATALINESLDNTITAPVNVTYIITPGYGTCAGIPFNLVVTVNPTAVITSAATKTICDNASTSYTATSSTVGATFAWTRAVVAGISNAAGSGATALINESLDNSTTAPVNVTYVITPSYGTCTGTPFNLVVTVNPTALITSAATQTVCDNTALGYTATSSTAGATFAWTRAAVVGISNAAGSGATALINESLDNTTTAPVNVTYIITPSYGTCTGTPFNLVVTVNPTAAITSAATKTICDNASTAYTATSSTVGATFAWIRAAVAGISNAAGSGSTALINESLDNTTIGPVNVIYIITPSYGTCTGTPFTLTVTVNPTTVITSAATKTVCNNTPLAYTATSSTAGATFTWTRAVVAGISNAAGSGATANINESLVNTTLAAINVTYVITPAYGLCAGTPFNLVVTVNPTVVITAGQNPSVCSGNALNYQILLDNYTNPGDNVLLTWPAPTLSAGVSGGSARAVGSVANITDTFTNTSGGIGTARFSVTAVKDGCTGPAVNVVINVGSEPVLDPGLNNTVCSNTTTGLTLKEAPLSVTPTYYNISSITIDAGLVAAGGNAGIPNATAPSAYLANDRFANFTGVNKTVTYRVQPILAPDCIGVPVDVVITIRPQPVIQPGQTAIVCSGVAINKEIKLIPVNTPAGTVFNWSAPVMSDASVQGTAGVNVAADPALTIHINDAINNYSSTPITATYTVTPTSSFGCAGDPVPVVITINQEPVPQPISGRVNLCVGDKNIVYNVNPVGGSSFHWTVAPAVGSITFDFNTNAILIDAALVAGSGNITVYETNSLSCSGDPSTLAVQVYSVPVPENIAGPAIVCANSTQVYSVTNRVGSVYNWTVPGGAAIIGDPSASSITIIFANVGGTILVRETNIAGCITNHNPFAVTVNPLPTALISNGGTMCDGGTRPLNVAFNGTAPFNFTYAINGVPQTPVSTSSNPYTINATLAGTYTIVNVTDNTGCTNTGSGSATITYFPKPTGIISGTAELCRGSSTTLTMTFTGVAPFTFTYTDGTTPVTVTAHPTNVYTAGVSPLVNSTYTLTSLTDFNNCVGVLSGSAVITVNQPPSLSLTGTNLICYNIPTGAVDMTINGGTAPFGIAWTGPNGFTSPTEDISGLNEGYYAVTVTDSKGCTATANITLTQPPALNATVAHTNVTCFNVNDGTITISGATGGTGTYEYTINGTTWAGSGTFAGVAPGTYNVKIRDLVNPTCILVLNPALVITQPTVLNATLTKTDITCFGANNGSIIISNPTGGYGTYQYTINGGTTWVGSGNFTNLTSGSYNVIIRDAINTGCAVVLDGALIVTEPPVLSATVNRTNITCFGSSDGTITISGAAGGHGTYEYSISGGSTWQVTGNYTGLTPGTYNVQIRDAAYTGCYIVLNNALVLTQPAILTATLASTNVTCNSANDGTISITGASGGYGTYEYTINGGTNWFASGLFTNVTPGTYDVRIRDAANIACVITLNAGLQITEPAALMAIVIDTDITCFGANNGVITITNSAGGYGTFQYSNNGGSTWQDSPVFSALSSGSYDVRIRDRAHQTCVVVLDPAVLITEPAALSATAAGTNVNCNGANDGIITISGATGGYGTYQYSINGGASWQGSGSFTGLTPGSYNVRMRDALNPACMIVLNPAMAITEPVILSASVARTNVTCFGAADGTIIISGAAGGYGTYDYSIDGGANWQTSGNFTALAPGFYNVQIRDAAHPTCIVTLNGSLRITEPSILSANVTSVNVTCNGANDGRITISGATGGYGTYEYSVGASWQASGTFTGLTPGSYNVQIRDAAHTGCVIVLNPALVITEPAPITAAVTPANVTCFGASNGIITITGAAGGYGTYEYSINGGTTWSGLNNFTNLAPGTYDVRIRDAAHTGCVITLNAALLITQPAVLHADVAKTNVTCFGGSDGTITITNPTGGYGTYEYSVNGGGSWQASGVFTALGPGNYNIQIRDAAHLTCVIVLDNSLQITQTAILNAVISTTMVTCNGANDGIINITSPAGGYGTYEYSADGGTSWQGTGTFSNLATGTYDVRIRDAVNTGCVITLNPSVMITEPSVLNAVVASTNVTCFGVNDGRITISSPTGGYGTYEYSVNGGGAWQTSGTFSSLTPGSYNVQIRDRVHTACVIVLNPGLVITEPVVLSATVNPTMVTCNGANDGIITITNPLGGYGTYSYTINGGATWQTSGTFNYLAPATYNVRIRDAANITCEIVLNPTLVITQPAKLAASVAGTNVTCFGANDGTISITTPTGGYGTYEFSIDGGANWQSAGSYTALAPGFYNVQIRDAAHPLCIVILNGSLRITEPPVLTANVTHTNVTCNGANNGTITITSPMGGYGTYEYSITGGTSWQPSGSYTALAPGSYNVQIRDAAQTACVIVLNPVLVITEPAILSATVSSVNISCFGANDGSISVSGPAGGYGTYQYSDNGGSSWQGFGNFTNLAPGSYDIRIRDAANTGCVITLNAALVITQPAVLVANIASTNVTCFGGNDGTITISGTTGGYGTYEYSINGGGSWQATGSFTGLTPGAYNILIRDAAHTGCIIVLNNAYMITQPGMLSAIITKTEVSCHGNNDGIISITSPSGGYGTYEYSIDGGLSWQASGNYTSLAPDTYDIRIRDAAHTACSVVLYPNLVITEPVTLSMSSTGDVLLECFGDMDGMGTFYASGGTMPYTFVIVSNTTGGTIAAPGFNSQTFFNAGAGLITVSVVDFNGCSAQATINITQPSDLNAGTIAADQVVCYGDNPVMLTEASAPTGGPGVYNFQWQSSTNKAGPFVNIAGATLNQYTPPAGAAYTLYYRRMVSSGYCMPVYSNVIRVLVNPRPVAFLTGGETICPGQSSIIKVTMLAGTGPFTVDIANYGTVTNYASGADIVVTPAVTTTYTLTRVRDANNCEVVAPSPNINGTATVTVSDLPVITSFTPSPAVCEFTLANFKVTATGTNLTYQWFVNEGSGFNAVVDGGTYFGGMTPTLQIFNTVRTMTGYIYHAVATGCGTSVTTADAVFTVNTAPEISIHPKDSTICLGQNAVMEADATGTSVTWQWYVNKGSGFVLSVDDANFSGSTTKTLTITNALSTFNGWVFRAVATGVCGVPVNTNFAVLRVINPPAVTLQPVVHTICENGSTSFLGNGTGYTSLQWQVFSGGVWTNLAENATYIGTNTQQLAIMNAPVALNGNQYRLALITGCATTYTNGAVLTVNANPVVNFSAIDPISACGGIPIVLNGNPTGGSGTYSQHRWTGDVGPLNSYTGQSPTFNSLITGSYNLNYRVTDSNGCTANDDVTVTVDSPSAQFTQDVDYGCTPLNVTFTKDIAGLAKWWWNFDDGSPLDSLNTTPVHTFINNVAGSIEYYNVKLKVRSPGGCYAEFTSTITIYPAVDATFTPNMTVVCSGNSITFTALSGASKYFWEYGDGVSAYATNVSAHLYTNFTTAPVVHTVKLTTTSFYNCVDVKTFDITVMPVPIPQFTADPVTQVFNAAGNPVTFTNTTNAGTWNWLWRFDDNSTSTDMNPVHNYTDVSTYNVTLIASNANCSDSVKHSVSVVPPAPVASFDSIPSGCAPLYVNINNTSLNTEVPGTTYRWDFGDGSTSTAKNPTYTYFTAGTYRIELVVTGPGGTSMATQVVNAYAAPRAYFEVTPPTVYVNDERVRCFNLSQGATSYLWDFGDGDTSKVKEPYHRYMEEGIFDITLWAYSENGCTDTYVLSPAVTVEPVGELRFSTVFMPNKTGPIERTDLPTGGYEADQFFYPPIRQKVLNYKLQIFNRLGVLIFQSNDINVPWNGYYKGNLCQQGVYVWYVEGKYADGKPFKMVGSVTLLQ